MPHADRALVRTRRSNRNILTDSGARRQIEVVAGLLWLLGWTAVLAAALALVVYSPEILALADRLRRHVSPAEPPAPAARTIEDVARSLRRLRREVLAPAPGAPMARRVAALAAYDDLLLEAARALGIADTLSDLPPGTDRDAERLRVEHLLRDAGLRLE